MRQAEDTIMDPTKGRNDNLQGAIPEEHKFQLLVDAVQDYAIYMLDVNGQVVSWNSGAQRLKGYTAAEIMGRHFSTFYTSEDRVVGVPDQALRMATTDGRFESEGWRVRKDGSRFWAQVVVSAIRQSDGTLIGFSKITRDVTERRQTAELLERARIALYQSQKMEAIGKLTGGIAHDFNNLLAVINNSLELLGREDMSSNASRVIATAQRAVTRGATLTQQLLAYARRQPLNPEYCSLNVVLQSIESVVRRSLPESISFEKSYDEKLRTVFVDVGQFEISILNLLDNSRDAMPTGGAISIATENVDIDESTPGNLPPGPYVKVTISDSGIGMSPEVASRATEPFFTTKGERRSSGMGLSQVYGFVTQSGGELVIDSRIGKGTVIALYFPVAEEAEETPAEEKADGAVRETALIVEDDPDLLSTAVELFQNMGYEVLTAADGLDAVDLLKTRRDVDVLFTDVVMPKGMSGMELARFTKRLCPSVKVILTSGYPLSALTTEHGNVDEFTLIRKPYRLSELAKELRTPVLPERPEED